VIGCSGASPAGSALTGGTTWCWSDPRPCSAGTGEAGGSSGGGARGIETLLTPFRPPQANALAERVVRTLRQECPDHVLVFSERHPEAVLAEDVGCYNTQRPHRSSGLVPLLASAPPLRAPNGPPGWIVAGPVLGGLHHVYERAA
jgi:transposase InsO family protein